MHTFLGCITGWHLLHAARRSYIFCCWSTASTVHAEPENPSCAAKCWLQNRSNLFHNVTASRNSKGASEVEGILRPQEVLTGIEQKLVNMRQSRSPQVLPRRSSMARPRSAVSSSLRRRMPGVPKARDKSSHSSAHSSRKAAPTCWHHTSAL